VRVLERVRGLRVVAEPAALDGARWTTDVDTPATVLRFAPDEAFAIGATSVDVDDEHAIVVDERGLVFARCALSEIADHLEWSPPTERPVFTQGAVAGVPVKVWLLDDEHAVLYAPAAYAHELATRLGWLP
jgi:hypothetical protein